MTEPIAPALTPEEWAQKHLRLQADSYDSDRNAAVEIKAGPNYLHLTDHENPRWAVIDQPKERHALAALALHGQSFGFTREDVATLRLAAEASRVPNGREADSMSQRRNRLRLIAARIEALLPPETA